MTHSPNDGGQAYPAAWGNPEQGGDYVPGMTLRDWFAGQALAGIVRVCAQDIRLVGETREQMFARKAFNVADAMLSARAAIAKATGETP